MATLTGIGGHIDQGGAVIGCLRTWTLNLSAALARAICSAASGGTIRVPGNIDWSGNYTAYGPIPAIIPKAAFTFNGAIVGSEAASVGVTGAAICDDFTLNIDIEGGGIVGHTVTFSANGALTMGTVATDDDDSDPDPLPANVCKLEFAEDATLADFNAIPDIRTMAFNMSADNKAYNSSSTAGQMKRNAGNTDCNVVATLFGQAADGWDSLPAVNSIVAVRVYTTASLFWLINFMRVASIDDMGADIEGAAMVGGSITFEFCSWALVSASLTEGVITKPGGGNIWP